MKQLNLKNPQKELRNKFSKLGVKMIGPETIYFSKDTKIGKNVTIEPYVVFVILILSSRKFFILSIYVS